ncbi:uncharacterized protein RCC_04212 [Ramularia collo-cygni]|uniref:Uncharacterized protein n=1 Tax=Ramularia collo-cygni TaxID=112498 RepID=A0A2D3UTN8_9PEZI|nr:uncharacterized protein RCC_04212 [Ramularia collo-cygni]CZT18368.1 uncharacterized protein RCC_04212 [Ramularia collo-cygni]
MTVWAFPALVTSSKNTLRRKSRVERLIFYKRRGIRRAPRLYGTTRTRHERQAQAAGRREGNTSSIEDADVTVQYCIGTSKDFVTGTQAEFGLQSRCEEHAFGGDAATAETSI